MSNILSINDVVSPKKEELYAFFDEILKSKKITNNGPFVKRLEKDLMNFTGTKYALATTNGTIALHLAIKSLELKGEIITTPFTFIASCSSIIWENCKPVFTDIDPHTFCLDPSKIEAKINKKTVAIMPVHVFGNSCDIDAIDKIAKRNNLKVIYDAAQAMGTTYNKQSVLNYGDISVLSMHAYKIVSAIEGGALFCNSKSIFENLFKLRYFGKNSDNLEEIVGTNAKMSEFNAAYGILSLKNFHHECKSRSVVSSHYKNILGVNKDLKFQEKYENVEINYAYFPLLLPEEKFANRIIEKGMKEGVEFRRYFYPLLNDIEFLSKKYNTDTPVARGISKRVICLPISSQLNLSQIQKVSNLILDVIR